MKKVMFIALLLCGAFSGMNAQNQVESLPEPKPQEGLQAAQMISAPVQAEQTVTVIAPAHAPVMPNTGNAERDAAEYAKAKEQWIAQYPKEYELMLQDEKRASQQTGKKE